MKKLIPVIVIGALAATALVANAFAAETVDTGEKAFERPAQVQEERGKFMAEETMAEMEALAEEAGLSLEEYMATMMPEMPEKADAPEKTEKTAPEGVEKGDMMERPEMPEDGDMPEDAPMMGEQARGGMSAQGGRK